MQPNMSFINELATLESSTIADELRTLTLFRDSLSAAARFGSPVPISYRRTKYKTSQQAEEWTYLSAGFPLSDTKNHMLGLEAAEINVPEKDPKEATDGWDCTPCRTDCLYLLKDRRWLLVERSGMFSNAEGSSSWFDSQYKLISDRAIIGRFPISLIGERLMISVKMIASNANPRKEELQQRSTSAVESRNKLKLMLGSLQCLGAWAMLSLNELDWLESITNFL
jgi:hypothetical protein